LRTDNGSALHEAIREGHIQIVRLLLHVSFLFDFLCFYALFFGKQELYVFALTLWFEIDISEDSSIVG
jgi:ankyrin repeat protein